MPEFMGKKITRAEESARHAYRRALEKSLRTLTKGTGWKFAYGLIFREREGWFIEAMPAVHIFEHVTKTAISVKPMAIDPIFWDIVGTPESRKQPLSFRANGAWTCRAPYYAEICLDEDDDPLVVGKRLLVAADKALEEVVHSYSVERFLAVCREQNSVDGSYLSSIIPTLITLNRIEDALVVCEQAMSRGGLGGFLAPEGSFSEMATAYLRRSSPDIRV